MIHYVLLVWAGIAYVGWYILAALIALIFAAPHIQEKYTAWKCKRDEAEYAAKYHKSMKINLLIFINMNNV